MKQKDERIEYIDFFRAIGIIFMVMGHVDFGNRWSDFIHAFHMPMFFFISGYFFKSYEESRITFLVFLIKKIKTLLVPYVFFGVGHYIILCIIGEKSVKPLINLFFINTDGLPIAGALWFLTALFFAEMVIYIIDRFIRNKIIQICIVILVALIGNVATQVFSFRLPFALDAAFVGSGFMYVGFLLKNCKIREYILKLSFNKIIAPLLLNILLIFINGHINMREGVYSFIPLFWINSIVFIIIGLNISRMLMNIRVIDKYKKIIIDIGKNSIVYLCLNQITILCITKILLKFIEIDIFLSKILILLLSMVGLMIITKIITNTKFRIIIGRF